MNPSEDPKQNKQQVVITTSSSSSSDQKSRGGGGARQDVVRLYECTFCKREFWNAQALGGHMNIHRKDKAKMMQYSSSSSSVDKNYNSGDGSKMIRWPWINNLGGDRTNTSTSDQVLDKDSQSSELDLELRLGPPPNPPHDSSTRGTRGFF